MTAPLSIIIPTLNAERSLLRLLPQLFEGLTEGLIAELIFADGGSTDQTLSIAEEAGAKLVSAAKGRGSQLAKGAAEAKGNWLFIVHADSTLPDNWCDTLRDHIEHHPQKAAVFRLAFNDTSLMARITAGWANLRTRFLNLPYGDQGLLIPNALYTKIGGYPDIPLMEDVAIAQNLRGNIRLLDAKITTNADKYQRDGWIKRGTRNLSTLIRYKLGTSPEVLAKSYNRTNHKSS